MNKVTYILPQVSKNLPEEQVMAFLHWWEFVQNCELGIINAGTESLTPEQINPGYSKPPLLGYRQEDDPDAQHS